MNETNNLDQVKDIAKEIAKDVYSDGGKPIVQPTGELIGLVPRAIKAALSPLEKWILQREYNVAETKKLLEEKLKDTPADLIEAPEPHIAVPAMQYISYCMDNETLRDMYANLLAKSMNKVVKDGVHPGFVEIIKQLSPDEAKILTVLKSTPTVATINLRYEFSNGGGVNIINNFSLVGEHAKCEKPYDTAKYFNNLVRLGLLIDYDGLQYLSDKTIYEILKRHPYMMKYATNELARAHGYETIKFDESMVKLTEYGNSFCDICLS